MASNNEFFAMYRLPQWQRKRTEIMQDANFTCQECGDSSTTLNVHHRCYIKGRKPWEYENHCLVCLCEPCHQSIELRLQNIKILAGFLRKDYLLCIMSKLHAMHILSGRYSGNYELDISELCITDLIKELGISCLNCMHISPYIDELISLSPIKLCDLNSIIEKIKRECPGADRHVVLSPKSVGANS